MSPPVWAQAFPGGVADADLQHALWRSGSGQLIALRLADGQLQWRSAEPLWPLLVGHGLALGLTTPPSRVVALQLKGEGAGTERWRSDALPWPDVSVAPPGNAASTLQAAWLNDDILMRWELRPLYSGGANPGTSRARPPVSIAGCLLDAATGALHGAPPEIGGPVAQVSSQLPSDDPTVLAQAILGGVIYRLQRQRAAGDMVQISLIAHDAKRGFDLWSSVLEEIPFERLGKGPRALRP